MKSRLLHACIKKESPFEKVGLRGIFTLAKNFKLSKINYTFA
jgi:hypothetical protein